MLSFYWWGHRLSTFYMVLQDGSARARTRIRSPISQELLLPQLTGFQTKLGPSPHLTSCYSHHLRVPSVPPFSYPNPTPSSKAILELSSSSTLCSSNSSRVWSEMVLPVFAMSAFNHVPLVSFPVHLWWRPCLPNEILQAFCKSHPILHEVLHVSNPRGLMRDSVGAQ